MVFDHLLNQDLNNIRVIDKNVITYEMAYQKMVYYYGFLKNLIKMNKLQKQQSKIIQFHGIILMKNYNMKENIFN